MLNMDTERTFGSTIRHRRRELDLTLAEVAELLGLKCSSNLSYVERGLMPPCLGQVALLAKALQLDEKLLWDKARVALERWAMKKVERRLSGDNGDR
jgi:transcriptional regulator with XRE-family HTH domain